MSALELQVRNADGAEIGVDVPVRLQRMDHDEVAEPEEVILRASDQETNVELGPGTYSVQVTLPDGQLLQRVVVMDEAKRSRVVLTAAKPLRTNRIMRPQSGRYLLEGSDAPGNILKSATGRSLRIKSDFARGQRAGGALWSGRETISRAHRAQNRSHRSVFVWSLPGAEAWTAASSLRRLSAGLHQVPDIAFVWDEQEDAWGLRIPQEYQREVGQVRLWSVANNRRMGKGIASLPIPWATDGGADTGVFLAGNSDPAVQVFDPELRSLLSFLGNRQLKAALPLLRDADTKQLIEMAVYHKYRSPLAACAGAYVGLSNASDEDVEPWHGWLHNLAHSFERVPDAQIIYAHYLLRSETGIDPQEIFRYLSRAFAAGIPFFSIGFSLMQDALTIISSDVPEARNMFKLVSSVGKRCDPTQLFTVLEY